MIRGHEEYGPAGSVEEPYVGSDAGRGPGGSYAGDRQVELASQTAERRPAGLPKWLRRRRPKDPKLLVVGGQATKQEIDIRLPLSIGREKGQGLTIAHPLVSRQHCAIHSRDDLLWVKDLGSANGTFVNGQRVGEMVLQPGDKLTVGPLTFVAVYQRGQMGPGRLPPAETDSLVDAHEPETPVPIKRSKTTPRPSTDRAGEPDFNLAEEMLRDLATNGTKGEDDPMGLFLTWAQRMAKKSGDERPDSGAADLLASDLDEIVRRPADESSGTIVASRLHGDSDIVPGSPVCIEQKSEIRIIAEADATQADGPTSESSVVQGNGEPTPEERTLGLLLTEVDSLQRRLFEHYQQTALTMQLVHRVQQDQMDLLRDELDRLCGLNDLLRRRMREQHPNMPRVSTEDDELREAEAEGQSALEALHARLMRQTSGMQQASRRRWKQIRKLLREEGLEAPAG